jgi:hypothetical protein
VYAEAFGQPGDLTGGFLFQSTAQVLVLETADVELAAAQCAEKFLVLGVKELKPG